MTHPEHPARLVVAARSAEEARALAWTRWYGRAPRDELEGLMREAFSVENADVPAESGVPISVGSNGETVLRLKGERAFEVGVWTFNRRCRLL